MCFGSGLLALVNHCLGTHVYKPQERTASSRCLGTLPPTHDTIWGMPQQAPDVARNTEARNNYRVYQERFKDELEPEHTGQTALMADGQVIALYNDWEDAHTTGCSIYGRGKFSLVDVGMRPADLGFVRLTYA